MTLNSLIHPVWYDRMDWASQGGQSIHYCQRGLILKPKTFQISTRLPSLFLPTKFKQHVMKQKNLDVSHMKAINTMRKIQNAFVWFGMKKDIVSFEANCPICIAHSWRTVSHGGNTNSHSSCSNSRHGPCGTPRNVALRKSIMSKYHRKLCNTLQG